MNERIQRWNGNMSFFILFVITMFCLLKSNAVTAQNKSNQPNYFREIINSSHQNQAHNNSKDKCIRLSKNVIPSHYDLHLSPFINNKTFEGYVTITLNALQPIKKVLLHSNKLVIHTVTLNRFSDSNVIPILSTQLIPDEELLEISLAHIIQNDNYLLSIVFTGRLDKSIVGLYSSTIKKGGTMVASKFQPTYARQAFPCFDEPDFKATYDITLVKPSSYIALSNMNVISKTPDEATNTEIVKFATSVPMSTYLACFVVCDFDHKETEINSNGIGKNFKLRSFAQRGETHKIDFAQDIGKRATEFYIKYYEVPFPLPKLDMIAIPDYVSGATEHWGLITYRETSFLVDETTASSQNKINVANTIAHELAHMWFGNLVTMKWWDEVWLNEGFASYMQVKSLNNLEPSWTMLDQFLTKTLHSVLVTDAKLSSHPIVQTVATPDQITAIFDSISYNKGSSVLRMLEGFIGEENFRHGVSDYLKKYKFGNTITQDLLSSLEPYFKIGNPDLNLTHIMDTWTRQMGYPLLTVSRDSEPNTYVITQSRFLLEPDAKYPNDSQFNYRWFVPVTYKTSNGANKNILWFSDEAENVRLTLKEGETWLKLNNNQVGYYRVNYPIDMWRDLIQQLQAKTTQLTISDRAHLVNEVFALAEARALPYELALDLSRYLPGEQDYVPWDTAASIFKTLGSRLQNSTAYDDLQKYVQNLVKSLYDKQNWEASNIGVIEGLLRTKILSLAAWSQLPAAEEKARAMFLAWLHSHGAPGAVLIEPDLRDVVYYYGMKSASKEEWEKLWQIYLKETDVQESSKLRHALAAPRDANILSRYLTLAWDESNIRSQDYLTVVQQISGNPSGASLVWDDVKARWQQLVDRFTLNSRYLGSLVPGITSSFNTEDRLKEMEDFFAKFPEAGAGEAGRRRALENVRVNVRWTQTQLPAVAAWLRART